MRIILNLQSMTPIYEQIADRVRGAIVSGELQSGEILPSVRALSQELKVSSLTVKKAYDSLEAAGLIVTVHGKGSYVAKENIQLLREEQLKEAEASLRSAVQRAKRSGITVEELAVIFKMLLEE